MNIDLFGQSLLVSLCVISVAILTYLILQVRRQLYPELLGIALLASLLIQIFVAEVLHVADELPTFLILILLPLTLSLYLPYVLYKSRRINHKARKTTLRKLRKSRPIYVVAFIGAISSLMLCLVLINGFYRYYPTLSSVFNSGHVEAATLASNGQVVLQYSSNSQKASQQTLESLIYGNNSSSTNGKLYSINIPGKISHFHVRSGWVYAPAIAEHDDSTLNLPVMVLLSGYPGAPYDWLHGISLEQTLDSFAKEHHGITPLVFVVDDTGSQFNDTECVNSSHGNAETYLTDDVPNYIKSHFPVSRNPANWAIGGLSMGGMCGAMLALVHPNVYNYFLDIGGNDGPMLGNQQQTIQTLFNGSKKAWAAHQPALLLQNNNYPNGGGFFASGKNDSPDVVSQTRELYLDSKQAGLQTAYETVEGEHTFNVFSQIFKDALPWISNRIGATSCSGSTTCN